MMTQIQESLSGLGPFLSYFAGGMVLMVVFSVIYLYVTPYHEIRLIREGKTAPAISFCGAVFGFLCPLISAIAHSVSLLDMIVWSFVAMAVQIAVFITVRLMLKPVIDDIVDDKIGAAVFIAMISVTAGLINAASMTY